MAKRKKKELSYEDYIADLAKLEEELKAKQEEVADAKKKKQEAEVKEGNKLGNALIKAYPDILKEMQNMKVDDYIVSESFVTKVYSGFEKKTRVEVDTEEDTSDAIQVEGYNAFVNDGANND